MNDPRMQSVSMPTALAPADIRTGIEEDCSDRRNAQVEELKHAVRTHIVIMNGVSDQLCAYLLKLIDFITDTNQDRKDKEISHLSYNITESAALYVTGIIDSYVSNYQSEGKEFPSTVKHLADNVLVEIGKWRSSSDKIAAKNHVLNAVARTLDAFAAETGTQYPKLVAVDGSFI